MKPRPDQEHRRRLIRELLATYPDALSVLQSGSGHQALNEDRLMLMPAVFYAGSYAELERQLLGLRGSCRVLYRHVAGRYLRCEQVVKPVRRSATGVWFECVPGPSGLRHDCGRDEHRPLPHRYQTALREQERGKARGKLVSGRRLIEAWPAWVRPDVVDIGVAWLEQHWQGALRVPADQAA